MQRLEENPSRRTGERITGDLRARTRQPGLHEPFMALSFLALPVIPELKLTDRGLVDVVQFQPVDLFVDP